MLVQACVRSGMCCKIAACGYGKWDNQKKQCTYLLEEDDDLHGCGKYDEIIKDPSSIYSPAFGQGCCSSLGNEARNKIIKEKYDGQIPIIEIDNFEF